MEKMARFGFRANPSLNRGEGVLFLFLFRQRLSLPEAVYIIFQKMKAAGERSINKRCIQKKPVRRKELTLFGIERLFIINNTINTIMSVFFFALYVLY